MFSKSVPISRLRGWSGKLRLGAAHLVTSEEIHKYRTDSAALAQWLDVSIVSRKGRAFNADKRLLDKATADIFPTISTSNLNGQTVCIPQDISCGGAKAKLVVFSFKHYGFSLVRSWIDPFIARYNSSVHSDMNEIVDRDNGGNGIIDTDSGIVDVDSNVGRYASSNTDICHSSVGKAVAYEICFVEYGFLSMAKSVFANNIKSVVAPSQVDRTVLAFGGVKDFAAPLLLPNVYTGYAYLLDKDNKIRWRASGQAIEDEVEIMIKCTEQLLKE